jgi:hypothetical protein
MRQLFLILILVCLNTKTFAQSDESIVKAVALEKLSMFITWPSTSLNTNENNDEFVITILGQNKFINSLEEVYKNGKIKGKKVKINTISNIEKLNDCNILFIPKIKISELRKITDYLKGRHILTVSDSEGFAEAGCFINLYEFENKLHFEINQKSLQDEGFIIDYRLLRVSKIINPVIE